MTKPNVLGSIIVSIACVVLDYFDDPLGILVLSILSPVYAINWYAAEQKLTKGMK